MTQNLFGRYYYASSYFMLCLFYLKEISPSSYNHSSAQTGHFFFLIWSFFPIRTATIGEGKSQSCRSSCSELVRVQADMPFCRPRQVDTGPHFRLTVLSFSKKTSLEMWICIFYSLSIRCIFYQDENLNV